MSYERQWDSVTRLGLRSRLTALNLKEVEVMDPPHEPDFFLGARLRLRFDDPDREFLDEAAVAQLLSYLGDDVRNFLEQELKLPETLGGIVMPRPDQLFLCFKRQHYASLTHDMRSQMVQVGLLRKEVPPEQNISDPHTIQNLAALIRLDRSQQQMLLLEYARHSFGEIQIINTPDGLRQKIYPQTNDWQVY